MVEFQQQHTQPMQGSPIGSWFNAVGTHYCSDDNSHTPYTYARRALACPVALRSRLTSARPLTDQEFFDAMFG